jgi:Rap1a immunity proteins
MRKNPFTILLSAIIILLLYCKPSSVHSEVVYPFYDARGILDLCEEGFGPPKNIGVLNNCLSYVAGVWDGYVLHKVLSSSPYKVCTPKGLRSSQLARVVLKYFKEHPEDLHYSASEQALIALEKAFPCKKEGE